MNTYKMLFLMSLLMASHGLCGQNVMHDEVHDVNEFVLKTLESCLMNHESDWNGTYDRLYVNYNNLPIGFAVPKMLGGIRMKAGFFTPKYEERNWKCATYWGPYDFGLCNGDTIICCLTSRIMSQKKDRVVTEGKNGKAKRTRKSYYANTYYHYAYYDRKDGKWNYGKNPQETVISQAVEGLPGSARLVNRWKGFYPRDMQVQFYSSLLTNCIKGCLQYIDSIYGEGDAQRTFVLQQHMPLLSLETLTENVIPCSNTDAKFMDKAKWIVAYPQMALCHDTVKISISCYRAADFRRSPSNGKPQFEYSHHYLYDKKKKKWKSVDRKHHRPSEALPFMINDGLIHDKRGPHS